MSRRDVPDGPTVGTDGVDQGVDHGPAAREVDRPASQEGRLERAIGAEVRARRRASGATLAEMAVRTGISKPMLSKIEHAQISCSLTTLARLADALDIPVTAFFRGADVDREAVHTPAGRGRADRRPGHPRRPRLHPARRPARAAQADGGASSSRSPSAARCSPSSSTPGTELLYMLEGHMIYSHGGASYDMRRGDTLQLDGEGVHGPTELVELPIRFLSVVGHPDTARTATDGCGLRHEVWSVPRRHGRRSGGHRPHRRGRPPCSPPTGGAGSSPGSSRATAARSRTSASGRS